MNYKRGDILICTTNEMYGQTNRMLIIGDKYKINDIIEMSDKTILDVIHEETNSRVGLVSDRHFITIEVYRDWKIKQLLK